MTEYRFNLGNDEGPNGIGLCFSVRAESPDAAVDRAKQFLDALVEGYEVPDVDDDSALAIGIVFYPSSDLFPTVADIVDETEVTA